MTTLTTNVVKKRIRERGLVYVSDSEPGIRRTRHGKGFVYCHIKGRMVEDRRVLDRIRKLAIHSVPEKGGNRAQARTINDVIEEAAAILGNTPAVCRSPYIDPHIMEGWRDGSLRRRSLERLRGSRLERALLRYLKEQRHVKT
jgi:DNA topoisomerase IB